MVFSEAPSTVGAAGVFRVRLECADREHEERLLAYLRLNGHFAYAVGLGLETVCVGGATRALHELLADTMHWWESDPDAALSVELVAGPADAAP